jgi:hypothetical protein
VLVPLSAELLEIDDVGVLGAHDGNSSFSSNGHPS